MDWEWSGHMHLSNKKECNGPTGLPCALFHCKQRCDVKLILVLIYHTMKEKQRGLGKEIMKFWVRFSKSGLGFGFDQSLYHL